MKKKRCKWGKKLEARKTKNNLGIEPEKKKKKKNVGNYRLRRTETWEYVPTV